MRFGFHEQVVGRLRPAELAEAGALAGRGFVPMGTGNIVHDGILWAWVVIL